MRNLINFLIRNAHWWLFLLLIFISVGLIVNDAAYPRSIYLSSANEVSGRVYQTSAALTSYIGLKTVNEDLNERVAEMEARIRYLEATIAKSRDSLSSSAILKDSMNVSDYTFITAQVVNNSVSQLENFITLDKGSAQGINRDMAVISATGVVGAVRLVSENFSVVIPILNPKFQLNCKLQRTNYFGPLVWDGINPRYAWLKNQPRHIEFTPGDTIVTSGFSAIFPPGIMVGTVIDTKKESDDNFNSLNIELSTDFQALKDVLVIGNKKQKEQRQLEGKLKK